jgi:hypothetical protein
VIWLFLAGSRSASEWLNSAPPGGTAEALLEGDPINRVVYAGLIVMGLIVLAFRASRVAALLRANAVIVLFMLYCALTLTWADYPDVGFKRWVKAMGDLVMVLIVVSERDPPVAIRQLLVRTGFLLIPLSVLLIKYYPHLARYYDQWEWKTYYSGVTTNKSVLGAICLLFGLASAWHFLAALFGPDRPGRVRRLIAHGTILAMVVWLLRLANSMTSWSCFLVGLGVLLSVGLRLTVRKPRMVLAVEFRPQTRNSLMLHMVVIFMIAVPSAVLFYGIESILRSLGKDPTLTDRTLIWGLASSLSPSAWWGAGYENFWLGPRLDKMWAEYAWKPNQAHSGYVETYLNLGLIGVGFLLAILAIGYQTVIAGLRRFPSIGGLMLAYFVIGVVYNFTEAAFFRMLTPVWLFLLLAITRVPDLQTPAKQTVLGRRSEWQPGLAAGAKVREHTVEVSQRNA